MAEQLTFDLPAKAALGREAFFVSPANALAVAQIEAWRDWSGGKLVLSGPRGAGKTHLAHVWAAEAGAQIVAAVDLPGIAVDQLARAGRVAVEDIVQIAGQAAAEQALFHLHNLVLAEGGALLLTGVGDPAHWGIALPDLASRVQGAGLASLAPPDDALLAAVLVKLFADRQLAVTPPLINYLVARIGRSFADAAAVVAVLDQQALAQARPLTRAFAADVLDKH